MDRMDWFVNEIGHWNCTPLAERLHDIETGMSLVIAIQADGGEIVVTADRRLSTTINGETIVKSDNTKKIFRINNMILAVAGKAAYALYVIKEHMAEAAKVDNPISYFGKTLRDHFTEQFSSDRNKWPDTELIFCKHTNGTNRIIKISEQNGFAPAEVDDWYIFSGIPQFATVIYMMFGSPQMSVDQHQRLCAIATKISSLALPSVSEDFDIWILENDGRITERSTDEVAQIRSDAKSALTRARLDLISG